MASMKSMQATLGSGVKLGIKSVVPMVVIIGVLVAYSLGLASIRAVQKAQVRKVTESFLYQALVQSSVAAVLAAGVDILLFDQGLSLEKDKAKLAVHLVKKAAMFTVAFALISLITGAVSGKVTEEWLVGSRSDLQKQICQEMSDKAAMAATAACAAAKVPLAKEDPVAAAAAAPAVEAYLFKEKKDV